MLNPGVGATIAVVRSAIPQLGPRERTVAEAISANPSVAARMAAAELAAHVGTSAATVTRACQSMGFDGYPHLRTLLVRDAGAAEQVARAGGSPSGPVHRLFAEAARELDAAPATIDLDAFAAAVTLVAGARRVVIIGSGGSAPTLLTAAMHFLSAGVQVEAPAEPMHQLLACRLLGPTDVVLALSDSGENVSTLPSARAAAAAGASVVAVTSFRRSALARLADVPLIVGSSGRPWPESALTSTMLQVFLLNALVVEVAEARGAGDATATVTDDIVRAVTGNRRPDADRETDSPSVH